MRKESFGCRNSTDKIGVLIAQLGTPDAPTKEALYPYLKQFLSDPRVIEKNRLVWWLVLNLFVLTKRPARSARLYRRIWTDKGSPLLLNTQSVSEKVLRELRKVHASIELSFGMRYGKPSLASAIDELIERGCSKIVLFNMYPQYSATTTASNYDAVFSHLLKRRWVPTLRVAEPYYAHSEYVEALAQTINEAYARFAVRPERLVLSYHGIPESYVEKGDPYCCMCTETTQALLPLLKIPANEVIHTYQSRFGRDPWLVPYTDETIEALARQGVKRIALAAPGFTADCLETLDELGNEGREQFQEHGGEAIELIPCLNDHPAWIEGMSGLILKEIGSWLDTAKSSAENPRKFACPVRLAKIGNG